MSVHHCYLSSNSKPVNICGIQCVPRYYIIPVLLNVELITDGQPFFVSVHVVYIFLETIHTELKLWVFVSAASVACVVAAAPQA